ncbi:MAG: hypothetical protein KC776_09105 [Myxococcales bacterium]|nr:hypothetical protein [Myxococcales bacterium]MCB9578834.1 hypothetical protein [Polyangiaceae bacterium]
MSFRASLLAALVGASLLASAEQARAGQDDVVLLPTVTLIQSSPAEPPELRRPDPSAPGSLSRWTRRLDAVLHEAAQDLGLTLDVSERLDVSPGSLKEDALVERAADRWVVSPRLTFDGGKVRIRLVAVAPGSNVVLVRSQEVEPRQVTIRAMVMLRDIVQVGRGSPTDDKPRTAEPAPPRGTLAIPARSQGRAVLALNAAAFGGYVGFALQRASGSGDERLTYPLIALGTGIGLGGSMIIADEWDVGLGDAWYLSAGAWWPAASGLLLAEGYGVSPESDRYVYGLVGASAGITLATMSLSLRGMGEGGALLSHSGGAFGMFLGGVTQLAVDGTTDETPTLGMGYGAGAGVLVAGAVATQVSLTPSRVLLVDLGGVLGGLTVAGASSPLVFADERSEGKDRAFLAGVAAGTLAGGVVGYLLTQPASSKRAEKEEERWAALPWAGVIGETRTVDGKRVPAMGAGVRGLW